MDKKIMLDGSLIRRTYKLHERFFGLRPDQSFQEINIDIDDENDDITE